MTAEQYLKKKIKIERGIASMKSQNRDNTLLRELGISFEKEDWYWYRIIIDGKDMGVSEFGGHIENFVIKHLEKTLGALDDEFLTS